MKKRSVLERLLSPVSTSDFLRTYFQRRPLLVRGSPGKFDFMFRQKDFIRNLDRVTEIRAVFPGLWQATINPLDIQEMMNAGATICVTGMERAHLRVGRIAHHVRSELSYAGMVTARAYLSPPGGGFDLHFDARVATTLQIAGTKRWWFSKQVAMPFPAANSPRPLSAADEVALPGRGDLRCVVLRPGDLLCLPAGTWHRARAERTSLALNLAFDHAGASAFEVIVAELSERIRGLPRSREPLPLAKSRRGSPPREVSAALREAVDVLVTELGTMRDDRSTLRKVWRGALHPRKS